MSFSKKSNNSYQHSGAKIFEAANGLDDFLKKLEKDFYANAKVQCKYDKVENRADLIIDLYLNFGLMDCLRHFNNGDWGGFTFMEESKVSMSSSITHALEKLNAQNSHSVDISEMSFHLQETSIIVSRLYKNSIPEQIGNIISEIGRHFVYFTKGLTEMPYEVFVPVFEDNTLNTSESNNNKNSYFDYWGLYFDKELRHQAMIYNLHKKKLEEEDLFLFE